MKIILADSSFENIQEYLGFDDKDNWEMMKKNTIACITY